LDQFFQAEHLTSDQKGFVAKLTKRLTSAIGEFSGTVTKLQGSISGFNETMTDYVNCAMEQYDIIQKYYYDDGQSGNYAPLPGIVSVPSSYDVNEVKSDNQRLEEIQGMLEQSEDQKNITQQLLQKDYEAVIESYKVLVSVLQGLGEAIATMDAQIKN
jgi:hypothetical protein